MGNTCGWQESEDINELEVFKEENEFILNDRRLQKECKFF